MGTAVALREGTPPVPGTPTKKKELVPELYEHARTLDVENRLRVYGEALRVLESGAENADYFLLRIDPSQRQLTVKGYRHSELQSAQQEYLEIERIISDQKGEDAVLVSVDSLASLRRAYPNYFADTGVFTDLVRRTLHGYQPKLIVVQPIDPFS
jgi:hypothetical protein